MTEEKNEFTMISMKFTMILAVVGCLALSPSLFAGDSDPPEKPIVLAAVESVPDEDLTTSQKLAREIQAYRKETKHLETVEVKGSLNCGAKLYTDGSFRMYPGGKPYNKDGKEIPIDYGPPAPTATLAELAAIIDSARKARDAL